MPERDDNDEYRTPYPFALAALKHMPTDWMKDSTRQFRCVDVGAGWGVWGEAFRDWQPSHLHVTVAGYELQERYNVKHWAYDVWVEGDMMQQFIPSNINLMIGNPPYYKNIPEKLVYDVLPRMSRYGTICFLLNITWLNSARRFKMFQKHPLRKAVVIPRPSFYGNGNTKADDYAFYYFVKDYDGKPELTWDFDIDRTTHSRKDYYDKKGNTRDTDKEVRDGR